jgi:hypothetical protein
MHERDDSRRHRGAVQPAGELGERALGAVHLAVGIWLMYLTYAATVDAALGWHWRV